MRPNIFVIPAELQSRDLNVQQIKSNKMRNKVIKILLKYFYKIYLT